MKEENIKLEEDIEKISNFDLDTYLDLSIDKTYTSRSSRS